MSGAFALWTVTVALLLLSNGSLIRANRKLTRANRELTDLLLQMARRLEMEAILRQVE